MSALHQARKRFGQHFLRDANVIHRILQAVRPLPDQLIVEIGPGLGAITRPLLEAAGRLEVIELDRDLIPHLQRLCQGMGELHIHNVDALEFDFLQLCQDERPLRLVGNLPYNISTPLLFHLLNQAHQIRDMHFMLQKEVVERMAAAPGHSAYGRLSVMLQQRCRVEPLFEIGSQAFRPPPKVESAFLRLIPYQQPPIDVHDQHRFQELVRLAFSQRRKTLRNSLRQLLSAKAIEAAGIDPGARPEILTVAEFARLSNCLE